MPQACVLVILHQHSPWINPVWGKRLFQFGKKSLDPDVRQIAAQTASEVCLVLKFIRSELFKEFRCIGPRSRRDVAQKMTVLASQAQDCWVDAIPLRPGKPRQSIGADADIQESAA